MRSVMRPQNALLNVVSLYGSTHSAMRYNSKESRQVVFAERLGAGRVPVQVNPAPFVTWRKLNPRLIVFSVYAARSCKSPIRLSEKNIGLITSRRSVPQGHPGTCFRQLRHVASI